jgi:hypothetical protein
MPTDIADGRNFHGRIVVPLCDEASHLPAGTASSTRRSMIPTPLHIADQPRNRRIAQPLLQVYQWMRRTQRIGRH